MRSESSLIVLKNYLGDAVMATPLLRTLSANYDRPLTLAAKPVREVLAGPSLNLEFAEPRNLREIANMILQVRELRSRHILAAFLVNRSFRSALAVRLAGIPVRVGHATEGRRLLLTHPLPYNLDDPEAKSYADLAEAVGLHVPDLTPHLDVSDAERAEGAATLQGATIGFQPGARYPTKQVPLPVMVETAARLAGEGKRIAILGGPDERMAAETFLREYKGEAVNLVGQCSLRQTMGVLSALSVIVGGDTGVMHLAAGLGCPTVTVFGPTPAKKWGHFEPPHQVIQAPNGDVQLTSSEELIEAALRAQRKC